MAAVDFLRATCERALAVTTQQKKATSLGAGVSPDVTIAMALLHLINATVRNSESLADLAGKFGLDPDDSPERLLEKVSTIFGRQLAVRIYAYSKKSWDPKIRAAYEKLQGDQATIFLNKSSIPFSSADIMRHLGFHPNLQINTEFPEAVGCISCGYFAVKLPPYSKHQMLCVPDLYGTTRMGQYFVMDPGFPCKTTQRKVGGCTTWTLQLETKGGTLVFYKVPNKDGLRSDSEQVDFLYACANDAPNHRDWVGIQPLPQIFLPQLTLNFEIKTAFVSQCLGRSIDTDLPPLASLSGNGIPMQGSGYSMSMQLTPEMFCFSELEVQDPLSASDDQYNLPERNSIVFAPCAVLLMGPKGGVPIVVGWVPGHGDTVQV